MSNTPDVSVASPECVRELLLKLKSFESKLDEWLESVTSNQIDHHDICMELNDRWVRFIVSSRKPPGRSNNPTYESSFSDNDLYQQIKTIYNRDIENMKQTVENAGHEECDIIPLADDSNDLTNWTTVLEYLSARLDNVVLAKLRELYSVIETMNLEEQSLILEEISNLISSIINYCEENREVLLKLKKLDSTLISPVQLGNIGEASMELSKGDLNGINQKGDD